jgi:S-adenosylmethionine synthetase
MSAQNYLFTSESVTEGHPDKICDQISDAVLDAVLQEDPDGRVAVETATKTGMILLFGELTTSTYVDFQKVVRGVIQQIGYDSSKIGFDYRSCSVQSAIEEQSPEIAAATVEKEDTGAGDQGMMFGYACTETPELMPLPISLSHKLAHQLAKIRHEDPSLGLRPDGKTQVTIEYQNGKPLRAHTIVISSQHAPEVSQEKLQKILKEKVINPIASEWIDEKTIYHLNPTGSFVVGGPQGDAGLTGRKIIVDTYGGYARHGGGAFSGKDPAKVDRSGAYMGRYIAKNIVAAGLAEKCEVQISYAIGVAEPISVFVDTFGTGKIGDEKISGIIPKVFGLKPKQIIEHLNLKQPIYQKTATYGHFGREEFPWEKMDTVEELKKFL